MSTETLSEARTLILFLPHREEPDVRIAFIQMSTIQAATFPGDSPRANETDMRDLLKRPGIYVLAGQKDSTPVARIGQSENVLKRLAEHRSKANELAKAQVATNQKDSIYPYWTTTYVFTSKDETLTTGHIRHIESRLTQIAEASGEATLFKGQSPAEDAGKLPLHERATTATFVEQATMLAEVLGLSLFSDAVQIIRPEIAAEATTADPFRTGPDRTAEAHEQFPVFRYNNHGVVAQMRSDGATFFRVLKGSQARFDDIPTLPGSSKAMRANLRDRGVLAESDSTLVFEEDADFRSLSAATQVVSGTSDWGKVAWTLPDGTTLGQWLEKSTASKQAAGVVPGSADPS